MGFIKQEETNLLNMRARRDVQQIVSGLRLKDLLSRPIEEDAIHFCQVPGIL